VVPNRPKKLNSPGTLRPLPGGIQTRVRRKVGSTSVTRLGWLVGLLNQAPEYLGFRSETERRELEAQVDAFCDTVGTVAGGKGFHLGGGQLLRLVDEIRGQVLGFLHGATFEIHIPAVEFVATADPRCRYMGSAKALFPLAVARLMEQERSRIKMCGRPDCNRLFVHRKRAIYCSRQCSQIETFKRYIARHGGR
jgi:hypothetical protein